MKNNVVDLGRAGTGKIKNICKTIKFALLYDTVMTVAIVTTLEKNYF